MIMYAEGEGGFIMRSGVKLILVGWLLSFALASTTLRADPFILDVLETDDLRLLYFDPTQTYLVPHVARSYHNSLEFQRYIFDWTPWEKTTVMLTDFSDYANAAAGPQAWCRVTQSNWISHHLTVFLRPLPPVNGFT
jgi:hypothetical protein